jgi:AraC-like DNA-binding protein
MDRHDVSETITAENVASLHQQDLKIQDKFNCRGLTYWFDDVRKTAFCLIEAPNENALKQMHNEAHGKVPHSIIEVDPNVVESFLGRIEDPQKSQNAKLNIISDPAFRIIMIIDLQPSSHQLNDTTSFTAFLNNYKTAAVNMLRSFAGCVVSQNANRFLVSFKSVLKAVDAALNIQTEFKKVCKSISGNTTLLKIAISAGSPVTEKKLIFEDAIKLAELMCENVKGEIVVSAEVKDLYKSENGNAFNKASNIVALTPADETFLNHLKNFMESSWANANLKAKDFTRPLGCSKSMLYRTMITLTGKPVNTFIKDYRLTAALQLLNKNSGNVSEIAFETGFISPSYFSRCFLKKYGYLPSAYLHSH